MKFSLDKQRAKRTALYFTFMLIAGGLMIGLYIGLVTGLNNFFNVPQETSEIIILVLLVVSCVVFYYKVETRNNIEEKQSLTKEQAHQLLHEFRRDCLPFGEYPDNVILEFLNKKFDSENEKTE